MARIRVAVCGALGKMGKEIVKTVYNDPELELVGAVDTLAAGLDVGPSVGLPTSTGIVLSADLKAMLEKAKPEVCIDFTHPTSVLRNALSIIEAGCRPVIGTTGLSPDDLKQIENALAGKSFAGMVVPNFAIGAVLLMKFAKDAARYFEHAEIIELHHNQKADAPSGTAIKTAELMAQNRTQFGADNAKDTETIRSARGAAGPADIRIHSVRLPGLIAHEEVIFGGQGQTLTIRHDSLDRSSFMPGVVLAVKRVMALKGFTYGLEEIL